MNRHVASDYTKMLAKGMTDAEDMINRVLAMAPEFDKPTSQPISVHLFSISVSISALT